VISDEQLRALGLRERTIILWGGLIRALTVGVIIGIGAYQLLTCAAIASTTVTTRDFADFGSFYEAGRHAREGVPNPYSRETATTRSAPNLNPPPLLFAFVSLSSFPRATAFVIYVLLSVLCAVIALRIVFREVGIPLEPPTFAWTAIAMLCAAPTIALLTFAQIAWILWAPLTWTWAVARRERWVPAAIVGGMLMSTKPFLGLFVPVLLIQRQPRIALIATAVAAFSFGIALLVFGWQAFVGWLFVLPTVTWGGNVFNGSIFGMCQRLFAPSASTVAVTPIMWAPIAAIVLWLISAIVVIAISMNAVKRWSTDCSTLLVDHTFAVTLSAALLVTPLGWAYYHVFLVGPFLGLLCTRERRAALKIRWGLIAVAALCFLLPPPTLLSWQPSAWATLTVGSAYFWGTLSLWSVAIVSARTRSI
jgi:hypothetical protein